ncbi:hypothetical protein NON00_14115 [Roseomonas sp. GC11]|uniref:hypothetical protein n=1 Tax=Roseomonas sp. GC11 TaxID=2950546 RepID=UPI002108F83B|nr:hypothetical protein [Roseomonas sp. GC11]MCQ4161056.1 hypothetical protein [Roseomonas sp. GC11]
MAEPRLRVVWRRDSLPALGRIRPRYAPPPAPANDRHPLPRWVAATVLHPAPAPRPGWEVLLAMGIFLLLLMLAGFRF